MGVEKDEEKEKERGNTTGETVAFILYAGQSKLVGDMRVVDERGKKGGRETWRGGGGYAAKKRGIVCVCVKDDVCPVAKWGIY